MKKWTKNTMNGEIYSFFEGVLSDSRIVQPVIRGILRRNKKQTIRFYNMIGTHNDISEQYVITVRNNKKFQI